jgi:hypothetical protein
MWFSSLARKEGEPTLNASWDQVSIGGAILPGIWELSGSVQRNIDIKGQRRKDGAIIKDMGYEPGKLSLHGRIIEENDWELLKASLAAIHPRKKGLGRNPLPLIHPAANALGLDKVYVVSIDVPRLVSQVLEVSIELIEWFPGPKEIKATAKSPNIDLDAANVKYRGPFKDEAERKASEEEFRYTMFRNSLDKNSARQPGPSALEKLDEPSNMVMGPSIGGTATKSSWSWLDSGGSDFGGDIGAF